MVSCGGEEMRILISRLLLVCSLLGVTNCGFHLRGTQGFELTVSEVHVAAANSFGEFSRELERALENQGIRIAADPNAEYNIRILSERTNRRPVATSADITVAEYELRLETRFEVVDTAGKIVISPTTLVSERIYSFDRTSLVGASEEEELLKKEMRRDIAGQLLRRFSATLRNLNQSAPKPPPEPSEPAI